MNRVLGLIFAACMMLGLSCGFAEERPVYVALGDSITTGYAIPEGGTPFAQIVAETRGYELVNYAINGNTSAGLLMQMTDKRVMADVARADLITITCGGNDLIGLLYHGLAEGYNAAVPEERAIRASAVPMILSDVGDARREALLLAAGSLLEGNPPFVQSKAAQAVLEEYIRNMAGVMAAIRTANPDVQVIVTTQYHPYEGFGGDYEALAAGMDEGIQVLREYIAGQSAALGYDVADVYSAFAAEEETLCNGCVDPLNMDIHPNIAGHAKIAECILAEIRVDD